MNEVDEVVEVEEKADEKTEETEDKLIFLLSMFRWEFAFQSPPNKCYIKFTNKRAVKPAGSSTVYFTAAEQMRTYVRAFNHAACISLVIRW